MPLLLLGGIGLLSSGGYFADKVGEGVNDASNGAVKIAIAAGIAFYLAKKTGVLK
jgi:hypothetical protein